MPETAESTQIFTKLFEYIFDIFPTFIVIMVVLVGFFLITQLVDLLNFIWIKYKIRTDEDQTIAEWNDGSTIEKIKEESEEDNLDFYWKETGE